RASCEDLLNGLGAGVGNANGPTDVRHVLLGWVDSQGLDDGAHEVGHADGIFLHAVAVRSGFAVHLPALDPAAGKNCRPGRGKVIATAVAVDPRRAAEFTHPDD